MTRQAQERKLKTKQENKTSGERWARNYAFLKQILEEEKEKLNKIWNRREDTDKDWWKELHEGCH